ncbi:DUF5677 domain-containing protein [Nitrosomonas sp.]|uniref:DUF6988 family protein n=1 Tax=Nitrosomonas sp. TaxID=42353 RepID=UPI00262CF999|nr:DUF5677 domain-containing protein [Nitrosomonas sp.]
MSLNKIISVSQEISIWLHQHTNETVLNNMAFREKYAICLFQQALDIEDGIKILLENNLPGAALALARPLFECYVRGVWLLTVATNEEVDKFESGKYYREFDISHLVKAIEDNPETDGAWIKATKDAHLTVLHDLTHGGTSHIVARCSSNTIEPLYSENHLISLAILGIEVKIRIGQKLLARIKNEEALLLLNEKAEEIRDYLFQFICPGVSK